MMNTNKYQASIISSLESLSDALTIPLQEIHWCCNNRVGLYREKTIPKKGKGFRTVYAVDSRLKLIQVRINHRIFANVKFASYLFGSISDSELPRDYLRCATYHCPSKIVASVDIKDFFDSVTEEHVRKVFRDFFNFPEAVCETLTKLCTFQDKLPQGAPTSCALANLVFFEREPVMADIASQSGLRYTRLIDDITISSGQKNRPTDFLKGKVIKMLEQEGFEYSPTKTKTQILSLDPLTVHGIIVTGSLPRISKKRYQEIRRLTHEVVCAASNDDYRTTYRYYKKYHKVCGLLSILKRVEHPAHSRLYNKLSVIKPLPSNKFKARILSNLERLEGLADKKSGQKWFIKECNQIQFQLGILGRTYPELAKDCRERLNCLASI